MILRSAQLRDAVLEALGRSRAAHRRGAATRATTREREAVARLADNARENGVEVELEPDGSLFVPGESVTDPVALTTRSRRRRASARARASRAARGWPAFATTATRLDARPAPTASRSRARRSSSTARASTRTRWRAQPVTSASSSIRARASSSCSSRPTRRCSSASGCPFRAPARRVCLCSRPWTASSSPGPTAHDQQRQARLVGAAGGARRGARQGGATSSRPCAAPSRSPRTPVCARRGRGVNYLIERSRVQPRMVHVGGDPLDRPVRMSRHRRARHGPAARGGRRAG